MNLRKQLTLAACLLALLLSFAGAFAAPASAQSSGGGDATEYVPVADESFVIYQDEQGETVCRPATLAERERIRNASGTHVIYSGAPRRKVIDGSGGEYLMQNSVEDTSGLPLQASAGLTIVLNGTAQLEAYPAAKNAFILAANRWESLISTPITITLNVDYGPNFFDQGAYPASTILGQTASFVIKSGGQDPTLSQVRTQLLATAAGANETALYGALPSTSLPIEYNGANSTVSRVRVNTSQARAIGFNLSGGTDANIGFNSNFGSGSGQFDFDPSDGITPNFTDFDAVVVHEIGHALGFTSSNGGETVGSVSIWDLFRFRPRTVNAENFGSTPRIMTKGGEQVMFGNFTSTFATLELNVSTGGPNPPSSDTDDGRQSSHWKDDQLFSNRPYIGIMDPTIARGLRRTISENDVRALELIGYSTVFTPTRPANDNFAAAAELSGASGNFSGTSLHATREAGEPSMQAGYTGDKSVWFNWTAPLTGTATFDTSGSAYDTTLGVYRGASVNVLLSDGQSDDASGLTGGASRVTLNVTAGNVYRINVDGWNGEYGNYNLNWTSSGTTPTPTPTPTVSYSVSGRVQDAGGNGLAGVRVAIDGPNLVNTFPHLPVTTDAGGNFQFSLLTPGGNYTVRPEDSRYTYAPATAVFNNIGANHTGLTFTASPLTVAVSGRVLEGSSPLQGVLVGFYDGTTLLQQTATGADGRWTFSGVAVGRGYNTYFVKSGYTFSPPGLIFLVGQTALDMGDVTALKGNSIDESQFFVRQNYLDFLGREPDASGLAFWVNDIEACGLDLQCRQVKRINVSAAFFLSIEFQNTGYLVERMYKTAYGDRTEASTGLVVPTVTRQEFMQDTPLISQNVIVNQGNWQAQLEANKAAYVLAFVQRARFTAAFPASLTPAQFVAQLNQNTGGALSPAQADALAAELALNNTVAGRASVLRKVAESAELDAREKSRAYVLMQYFGYLRRNPSDAPERDLNYAGWNYWLGKLNEFGGDAVRAEMIKAFLDSAEYRNRFGQ